MTPDDTLAFKYKQWQWVSSTGKIPYFDSTYDLSYTRALTKQLGLTLGARLLDSDYTSGNQASSLRNDLQVTFTAGVRYAFNSHLSADLTYTADLGRNVEDHVANAQFRQFNRNLISLGAQFKF